MAESTTTYGQLAVVAGGSEGLGAAWARGLAAAGHDLLLIADQEDPLASFAEELRTAGHVVDTAVVDLAAPDRAEQIASAIGSRAVGIGVYNAAHSLIGPFLESDVAEARRTVAVNVDGLVDVAHLFAGKMVAQGRGALVLVSSLSGLQGTPLLAAYGASKAFTICFGEALWAELAPKGVDVITAVCGAIDTPNFRATTPEGGPTPMDPDDVVASVLAQLGAGPIVFPSSRERAIASLLGRVLSPRQSTKIMDAQMQKMYADRPNHA